MSDETDLALIAFRPAPGSTIPFETRMKRLLKVAGRSFGLIASWPVVPRQTQNAGRSTPEAAVGRSGPPARQRPREGAREGATE